MGKFDSITAVVCKLTFQRALVVEAQEYYCNSKDLYLCK